MGAELANILNTPLADIGWPAALLRMIAALLFGGVIGWEREVHERPAGLRTHMMIALAACLFTFVAYELAEFPAEDSRIQIDPLRMVEAVTAGVAFLAAGSIITTGGHVKGLTTGAGMWLAGAIGLTCGIGQLKLAALATALALMVLWLLRVASRAVGPKPVDRDRDEKAEKARAEE